MDTAEGMVDSLTPAYPRTVVLVDGRHLVLRPRVLGPRTVGIVAGDGATEAGQVSLMAGGGPRGGPLHVAIVLAPAYRGRRLGTWLLLDAIEAARTLQATEVVVEVALGLEGAEAALDHLDFVADAATPARWRKRLHRGWPDF